MGIIVLQLEIIALEGYTKNVVHTPRLGTILCGEERRKGNKKQRMSTARLITQKILRKFNIF